MTAVVENPIHVQIEVVESRYGRSIDFLIYERVALREPPVKPAYPHFRPSGGGTCSDGYEKKRKLLNERSNA